MECFKINYNMVLKKPIGKPKKFTAKGASNKPKQGRKF